MVARGKHFPETHTGSGGSVVNFINDVKLGGSSPDFQYPISIHITIEKVHSCLQQGQDKGHCPEFLLHIRVQSSIRLD